MIELFKAKAAQRGITNKKMFLIIKKELWPNYSGQRRYYKWKKLIERGFPELNIIHKLTGITPNTICGIEDGIKTYHLNFYYVHNGDFKTDSLILDSETDLFNKVNEFRQTYGDSFGISSAYEVSKKYVL